MSSSWATGLSRGLDRAAEAVGGYYTGKRQDRLDAEEAKVREANLKTMATQRALSESSLKINEAQEADRKMDAFIERVGIEEAIKHPTWGPMILAREGQAPTQPILQTGVRDLSMAVGGPMAAPSGLGGTPPQGLNAAAPAVPPGPGVGARPVPALGAAVTPPPKASVIPAGLSGAAPVAPGAGAAPAPLPSLAPPPASTSSDVIGRVTQPTTHAGGIELPRKYQRQLAREAQETQERDLRIRALNQTLAGGETQQEKEKLGLAAMRRIAAGSISAADAVQAGINPAWLDPESDFQRQKNLYQQTTLLAENARTAAQRADAKAQLAFQEKKLVQDAVQDQFNSQLRLVQAQIMADRRRAGSLGKPSANGQALMNTAANTIASVLNVMKVREEPFKAADFMYMIDQATTPPPDATPGSVAVGGGFKTPTAPPAAAAPGFSTPPPTAGLTKPKAELWSSRGGRTG